MFSGLALVASEPSLWYQELKSFVESSSLGCVPKMSTINSQTQVYMRVCLHKCAQKELSRRPVPTDLIKIIPEIIVLENVSRKTTGNNGMVENLRR